MFSADTVGLAALLHASLPAVALQEAPDTIVVTLPKSREVRTVDVPARCAVPPVTNQAQEMPGHPGDSLRARLGLTVPKASALVIVHRGAAHHTSKQWSVVAWRNADGLWTVQRGGETGGGLLARERVVLKTETWLLPVEAGETLDGLLSDAGTFEEPALGEESYIGSLDSTMEVISTAGRRTVCWSGKLTGRLGAIADHVMDPN